jgi:hypothetical protein
MQSTTFLLPRRPWRKLQRCDGPARTRSTAARQQLPPEQQQQQRSAQVALLLTKRRGLLSLADLCADAAKAAPLLSLGLESLDDEDAAARSPLRVVVVDNAHLLSKRAMSRLLDQWTRNDDAAQRRRELCAARTSREEK